MGRQTRTLGANRVLDDLNQDLLPLPEQIGDVRVHGIGLLGLVVLGEKYIGEIIEDSTRLPDVEECVAGQPDIDEGGLHARQDPVDPSLVDVADDRRGAMTLRPIRDKTRVLQARQPAFRRD